VTGDWHGRGNGFCAMWLDPLCLLSRSRSRNRRFPQTTRSSQYLFALLSVAVADEADSRPPFSILRTEAPPVCYGTQCFQPSLWVAMACAAVSAIGFVFVARRWKV